MTKKPVRTLLAAAALTALVASAGATRAEDAASLDPAALDAAWRAAPVTLIDGSFQYRLPAKAGELVWHKLPFAFRNGGVIEVCALRGTVEARALLDDVWVALGPIGNDTPAGPCVLVSGQRVLVANASEQPTTGRATPK